MGPIRGSKKRKRAEKKDDRNAVACGLGDGDWWDEFSRRIAGPVSLSSGTIRFETIFKISRKTFNYICSVVREDLMAKPSNLSFANGKVLSVDDQVAVALRRLSSGDSLLNVGATFGMNHSTVSQVTWRFVEAMEQRGIKHLRWPTEEETEKIKCKFEKISGLPNCCGAIDTTHIMMSLSSDTSNEVWVDPAKKHSMVLQAIVDPEMKFRDIVTGWPGRMNNSLVLHNSGFYELCERGTRLNGKKIEITEGPEIREYIIGNASFPLLPWLLTPYQGKDLLESRAEFNKRHFATRMVAQRAFARLKEVWKIVQREMWRPDKHKLPRIILVCCLLHNITIDLEDEVRDEMPLSQNHDSGYKQQFCDVADKGGHALREKVSGYFSGHCATH